MSDLREKIEDIIDSCKDVSTKLCELIEQERVKAKQDREFLAFICYSVWQDGNIDGWEEHKKETKHFGDCTNEPNTCHVCFTETMYKLADKIQSQLKESEG